MPFSSDPSSRNKSNLELEVSVLKEVVRLLTEKRKELKMSLRQLSTLTGYGFGYHGTVERGEAEPGIVALLKWSKSLNLNLAEILIQAEKNLSK